MHRLKEMPGESKNSGQKKSVSEHLRFWRCADFGAGETTNCASFGATMHTDATWHWHMVIDIQKYSKYKHFKILMQPGIW